MVYLPELPPAHKDLTIIHDNTARLVLDAIFRKLSPVIRHYHSQNPSVYVDISRNYWKNMKHLKCYKSQYKWHAPLGCPILVSFGILNVADWERKMGFVMPRGLGR